MNIPQFSYQYTSDLLAQAQDQLSALNLNFNLAGGLGALVNSLPTAFSDSFERIIAFLDTKSPQSSAFYVIATVLILYIVYTAVIAVVRWVIGTVVGLLKFAFFITLIGAALLIINQVLDGQQGNNGSFPYQKSTSGSGQYYWQTGCERFFIFLAIFFQRLI